MPKWHLHSQKPELTYCQIIRQTDAFDYVAVFTRSSQIQTSNLIRFIEIGRFSAGVSPAGPSFFKLAPIRDFFSTFSNYKWYHPKYWYLESQQLHIFKFSRRGMVGMELPAIIWCCPDNQNTSINTPASTHSSITIIQSTESLPYPALSPTKLQQCFYMSAGATPLSWSPLVQQSQVSWPPLVGNTVSISKCRVIQEPAVIGRYLPKWRKI